MSARAAARALGRTVATAESIAGGDIADAERVQLDDGRTIFVKSLPEAPEGLFTAEAAGLRAVVSPGGLNVPEVLAVGDEWLALEWIERGPGSPEAWESFGRGLAHLHAGRAERSEIPEAGFIGTLPQDNGGEDDWPTFYGRRRILAMVEIAISRGGLDGDARGDAERLVERLPELCGPPELPASTLHGDLWSGNAIIDTSGRPWVIDPAVYAGHREIDLAMMQLFGGFPEGCFAAYDEVHPRAEGHEDRVALYQLYPLLVHAAFFQGSYGPRCRKIIWSYL